MMREKLELRKVYPKKYKLGAIRKKMDAMCFDDEILAREGRGTGFMISQGERASQAVSRAVARANFNNRMAMRSIPA